jgi:hypothetical protein
METTMRKGMLMLMWMIGASFAVLLAFGEGTAVADGRSGSSEAGCNYYGCWERGGGCNYYGCWERGGGCNYYGCWRNGGGCNYYGCWNSPRGSCNYYGCTDDGECNYHGCPGKSSGTSDRRRDRRRASVDALPCEPVHAGAESEAFFAAAAQIRLT